MTNDLGDRLREILQRGLASQPDPGPPHPVDDENLLRSWSDGSISASTLAAALDHLARCPECRQVLDDLVSCGVFVPAAMAAEESDPAEPPTPSPPVNEASRGAWMLWALGIAAVVLGLIAGVPFLLPADDNATLTRLEGELQTAPDKVLAEASQLLARGLSPESSARARRLVEESSFELARGALAQRRYDEAAKLVENAEGLRAASGRLADLRWKAHWGGVDPTWLASNDRLTRRFSLRGEALEKNLVFPPQPLGMAEQESIDQLQTSLKQHPESSELCLTLAWQWLRAKRPQEAAARFHEVARNEPRNFEARLGLGIARFELGQLREALLEFEAASDLQPEAETAKLNRAITLEALGKAAEAKPLWEELLRGTSDPRLREKIRERLGAP